MKSPDLARLVGLAAIWGGSFLFFRLSAPALGPLVTAELRALLGGLALLLWFRIAGTQLQLREHWRAYLVVGTFNSALPFMLFAFASMHLSASYAVILNASAPFWGAVFSALWLGERLTLKKVAGLLLGVVGVGLVMGLGLPQPEPMLYLASGACLLATMCYSLAGIYLRKTRRVLKSQGLATGSLLGAALVILPLTPLAPPQGAVTPTVVAGILGLALLCSTVAFVLYFRLVADVGPTRAMTVTFLMPAFGMLWGALLLGERVTWVMLAGCALILAGTALVFDLLRPRARQA
ncbi:MAG TPA: DMT family transporter [Burkholderiales bacterium]|nr:DMT family transporter [Burkholderiales bacterium]